MTGCFCLFSHLDGMVSFFVAQAVARSFACLQRMAEQNRGEALTTMAVVAVVAMAAAAVAAAA